MSSAPAAVFDLRDRVALVTGASRGIGLAVARGLAACGARLILAARKPEPLAAMAAELTAAGHQALAVPTHVGDEGAVASLFEQIDQHYGRLDIVISNAATNPTFGPVVQATSAAWDKVLSVNLKGAWLVARAAHPLLKAQQGALVLVSSVAGLRPEAGLGVYSASKAALNSLSRTLAREWAADGIRVNAVCPGLVQTDFSAALWQNPETLARFLEQVPLARLAQADEIVPLILFLASPAAAYCTGGLYPVDGGLLS